jgi:hypothetical protein
VTPDTATHIGAKMPLSDRDYATALVLNPPESVEPQRTYVIFGTRRGGTSMVAGAARALGLDLGDVGQRKNNEDPRFQNRPLKQMREAIETRNAEGDVWGWKFPAAGNYLPELSNSLRNPYFVIVYRDPVAAALSQAKRDRQFNRRTTRLALHESSANNAVNTGLALATSRPCLLVSNERAIADPDGLIEDIAAFLGQDAPAGVLRQKILAYIKPGQYKSFDEFFGPDADKVPAALAKDGSPEQGGFLRRLRGARD